MSEVPDAPLTVAAVASRLGVAASTLRTWDRRYGLGPTSHEAGAHRRYSRSDVARLERMRALTLQGVAPADAAKIAMSEDPDEYGADQPKPKGDGPNLKLVKGPELLADPLTLVAAALEPDQPRTERIISFALDRLGILRTWAEVVRPALKILRNKSRIDRCGVEPDATIAAALCSALGCLSPHAKGDEEPAVGILTGPNGTMHGHIIAAELDRRGARVFILRPAVGAVAGEIMALLRKQSVRAVVAVGGADHTDEVMADVSKSDDLAGYLVGRHVPDLWLPRVHRVRTVPAAVEEIAACLDL